MKFTDIKQIENEIKKLKKLPISRLSLIILNTTNEDYIRKYAEIELRQRIKNIGCDFYDFLDTENQVLKQRGLQLENYLIQDTPTLQQLMETYFLYSYDTTTTGIKEDHPLLFSERHLCNNMTFCSSFFDKVCSQEIENITKRINDQKNIQEKEILLLFKNALEKRKQNIEYKKEKYYNGIERLEFNEAFQILDTWILLSFGNNISEEEEYKITCSKTKHLKKCILSIIEDNILDYDIFQNIYGLKKVIQDSKKLKPQKQILLDEVRNGTKVNYSKENFHKVLKKINTTTNTKK